MEGKKNVWALLPIFIFLILYLGLGILFEYVLKISMGFYSVPNCGDFFYSFINCLFTKQKALF